MTYGRELSTEAGVTVVILSSPMVGWGINIRLNSAFDWNWELKGIGALVGAFQLESRQLYDHHITI